MRRSQSIGVADLHVQMRITNRLLAVALRERMPQQSLIKLLAGTGATAPEIADVLDTTPGTVNVTLVRIRKLQGGGRRQGGSYGT